MARTKKKSVHYVDNAKFLEAMKEWKDQCRDAEETGDEKPRISNYIGSVFSRLQMVFLIDQTLSTTVTNKK